MIFSKQSFQKGFTLIELLIVIAVLGVLSAIVMVALNPVEQLNRGEDAGRINSVSQIGHAVEAFGTTNANAYPAAAGWMTTLSSAGELKQNLTSPASSLGVCNTQPIGNFCYSTTAGTSALVWTILESANSRTRVAPCASPSVPAAVYDTTQGKAGIVCLGSATTPPTAGMTLR